MRLLSFIFSLVVLCIVVGAFFLYLGLDEYISSYLTSHLGTKTHLDGVRFSTHTLKLKGLTIASTGRLKHAFEAKEIVFEAPLTAYWKQTIHLKALRIEDLTIGVELFNSSGSNNNWVQILKNFPQTTGPSRRFVIDRLTLSNIQFNILKSNGKPIPVPIIPHLEFRNLGKSKPLTASEIGQVVFRSILTILTKQAALSKILNNVMALPEALLQEIPIEGMNETLEEVKRRGGRILREIIGG